MRHAAIDMIGQNRLRGFDIAFERTFQQRPVLFDGRAAAVLQGVVKYLSNTTAWVCMSSREPQLDIKA